MKDKELESNSTNFLQPQDGEGYIFYEPRQSGEQINLNFVLDGLRKYWYASILVSTLMMAGIAYKIQTSPLIYKSEIQIAIDLKESASLAEKLATTIGSGAGLPESQSTTIETTIQTLMSKTIIQAALDSIPDRELRPSIGSVLANLKITSKKNTAIIFIVSAR